jgi:hypothetical protein
MSTKITITPKWSEVANLIILGLENGTEEGKQMAREELRSMASTMDQLSEMFLASEKEKEV